MKQIKWKSMVITCGICLLSILLGVALWERLPDTMAIHFNIHNEPDNFAPKGVVVFGLPVLMALMQALCCFVTDLNSIRYGASRKLERVAKGIIPVVSILLHMATLGYALGWDIDIRRVAGLIVGVMFLAMGNYLPKLDYIKHYKLDTEKARKINRFVGFEMVIMGLLFLVSLLLPPVATVICLCLLIPCTLLSVGYAIKVVREK